MNKPAKKPDPYDRITRNPDNYALYSGEVMLKEFDQDTVTLWLNGLYDDNPFSTGRTSPGRPNGGTRYLILAVEIGDDEMPVDIDKRARLMEATKHAFKDDSPGDKVVKKAAIMCKDRDFQRYVYRCINNFSKEQQAAFWLTSAIPAHLANQGIQSMGNPELAEQWCKHFIYYYCDVQSRRNLGFYPKKRSLFNRLMHEFENWGRQYANGSS